MCFHRSDGGQLLDRFLCLIFFDDSVEKIGSSIALKFADDKKLMKMIRSEEDAIDLQNSITDFNQWSDGNGLKVNVEKTKVLAISLKKKTFKYDYYIYGRKIERVDQMRPGRDCRFEIKFLIACRIHNKQIQSNYIIC